MNTKLKLALAGALAVHTWANASPSSAALYTTCEAGGNWQGCTTRACSPNLYLYYWTGTCVNREGTVWFSCSCPQ
jgi:hypothetical protein